MNNDFAVDFFFGTIVPNWFPFLLGALLIMRYMYVAVKSWWQQS